MALLLALVAATTVSAIPSSKPRPASSAAAAAAVVPPPAAAPAAAAAAAGGGSAGAAPAHTAGGPKGLPRFPGMGFLNAAFQHHGTSSSSPAPVAPAVPGGASGPDAARAVPTTATAAVASSGSSSSTPQPPVRPASSSSSGKPGWFHHHAQQTSKLKLPVVTATAPAKDPLAAAAAGVSAVAPLAAAAGGGGGGAMELQPGSSGSGTAGAPASNGNGGGGNNRFAFVNMKGFWESLKSWASFKHYLRGLRDLVLIAKPVEHFLLRSGAIQDRDLSRFIGKAVSFMIYSVLVTSILGTFGIDTKPLITGIGISGFVVGFALKEIATNTLSGILLVVQRPFKTGWKIKVGSHCGVVLSIDSRYVRLQTDDGQQILLPSYQVYSQAIVVQEKTDKYGRPIPAGVKLDTSAAAAAAAASGTAAPGTTPPTTNKR